AELTARIGRRKLNLRADLFQRASLEACAAPFGGMGWFSSAMLYLKMSRRTQMLDQVRNTPSRAGARKRGQVGYRKPPEGTRFKPGQSGNPKGRPKGVRNFETDLDETLRELVDVNKGGVRRRVTNQKAMLINLLQKAL